MPIHRLDPEQADVLREHAIYLGRGDIEVVLDFPVDGDCVPRDRSGLQCDA